MGVLIAILGTAAETLLVVLLRRVTPVQVLISVYLPGLLLVPYMWGVGLGLATAVAGAVAFDLAVVGPDWSLRPATGGFLATLAIFLVVACLAAAVALLVRSLGDEVDARTDADLSARLADLLQGTPDVKATLPAAARQLERTLGLPSARFEPGAFTADEAHATFPLRDYGTLTTLVVPADLTKPTLRRLRERAVPSLESALRAAREREEIISTARANYDKLRRIADEQAALRNLATLIARSVPPSEVFDAVAREMAHVLGTDNTVIAHYEEDGTTLITAGSWNYEEIVPSGSRWKLEEGTVSHLVFHTRVPGRVESYNGNGALTAQLRERGVVSSVGCPIMVGKDLWGVAIASSSTPEPLPADIEEHMLEFAELAATAIANAQSHADLIASRARVVTATDETRRRIERDLHDGTQQHLVSIGLRLRAIETAVPPELPEIKDQISDAVRAMDGAVAELQEISRGLHPAILSRGGLRTALSVLARRSAIEVGVTVSAELPLPEPVEVTIYYVVSEALTNAAKHAGATKVDIDLTRSEEYVRVTIRDDGIGGADHSRGSGLTGLTDRVNALGGRMEITSPAGDGTTLIVEIPWEDAAN